MQQQYAGRHLCQRLADIDPVQIEAELAVGRGDGLVQPAAAVLPARQRQCHVVAQAFGRFGQQVRHHRADGLAGVVEGFHRHHAAQLRAKLACGEDRGGRAIGHAEQVQRPADFALRLQRMQGRDHVLAFAGAVTGGRLPGAAMVAQVQGNGSIALLRQLQRPRQQRAAIHHPAMQQDHRAARGGLGGGGCGGVHRELGETLALAEIVVLQVIVAGFEADPMQGHAVAAGHHALPVRQARQQRVDACSGNQWRSAAGGGQARAE